MGKSAKLHKRVKKKTPSSSPSSSSSSSLSAPSVQPSVKKRVVGIKSKSKGRKGEHVLGGADYVTLLLGGRRKAAEEALKLPVESE